MNDQAIRFDDGAAYERMMGQWSRAVGETFLEWLQPRTGQCWVDVGCGNGAFTELVTARCSPKSIDGVDPSEAQLEYARQRHTSGLAQFHLGEAKSLPFADSHFDVAVMALVIFFVPEPAKGVAEMRRAVKPGGLVAAYAWDMPGGGFPFEVIIQELLAAGLKPPRPPQAEVSALGPLQALWQQAGLDEVRSRSISVTRTFVDFEEFWSSSLSGTAGQMIRALPSDVVGRVKAAVMAQVPADAAGRVTRTAVANAVSGRVPA